MAAAPAPVARKPSAPKPKKKDVFSLVDFVNERDWVGAVTLLEFNKKTNEPEKYSPEWLPYCVFHLGDFHKAASLYQDLITKDTENANPALHTYLACCYFYLGMFKEAEEEALKNPKAEELSLHNRLMVHLYQKKTGPDAETKMNLYHKKLSETALEDQLCTAALHYRRSHYQEAIDLYKRLLLENPKEHLALNVYVALCYYKLDYYDVSHEVLIAYLQNNPDSAIAINLKACNHFKLYNGKAGETELKRLTDLITESSHSFASDLVKHNMVVFRSGENALQVLPPLINTIPEAKLNLVIYFLRNDEVDEAYQLIKDLEPTTPQEYMLKGVALCSYGQKHDSREQLKLAQQFFHLVGSSPTECDTIPGRQCMASCFFLLKQFEDVLIYLNSIKSYFTNDDDFNWNFGIAKACFGDFRGAEEALQLIQNEAYKNDYCYLSWLTRCYINNGKPLQAWELYLKMETSSESFTLLQLIANDCYKMGEFYFSAKAFDVLERLEPTPENWLGKRGACVGVFQQVIAGGQSKERLRDVYAMLQTSSNQQVENIQNVIKKWAKENNVKLAPPHGNL